MDRFQRLKGLFIGHLRCCVTTAWRKRHGDIDTASLCCLLNADITGKHNHIGNTRTTLGSDALDNGQDFCQTLRLIASPVSLWAQANARTISTATFVRVTIGASAIPSSAHQLAHRQSTGSNFRLNSGNIDITLAYRYRVLPNQLFSWHIGTDIACFRA